MPGLILPILPTFLLFLPFLHTSFLILYSPEEYPILDTEVGLEDTEINDMSTCLG